MVLENGVKNIQAAAYNGVRYVAYRKIINNASMILEVVNKRRLSIIRQGDKTIEWVETSYLVNSHHFLLCQGYCRTTSCGVSMF